MCEEDKAESLTKNSLPMSTRTLSLKDSKQQCLTLKYSSNVKALCRPHVHCNKRLGEYKMLLCPDDQVSNSILNMPRQETSTSFPEGLLLISQFPCKNLSDSVTN